MSTVEAVLYPRPFLHLGLSGPLKILEHNSLLGVKSYSQASTLENL